MASKTCQVSGLVLTCAERSRSSAAEVGSERLLLEIDPISDIVAEAAEFTIDAAAPFGGRSGKLLLVANRLHNVESSIQLSPTVGGEFNFDRLPFGNQVEIAALDGQVGFGISLGQHHFLG